MRNLELRQAEATLRAWFRDQSDRYLTAVVDECRAGIFCFSDNCHCLLGLRDGGYFTEAEFTEQELKSEDALYALGGGRIAVRACFGDRLDFQNHATDGLGRIRTLPLALAELRRRNRTLSPVQPEPVEVRA